MLVERSRETSLLGNKMLRVGEECGYGRRVNRDGSLVVLMNAPMDGSLMTGLLWYRIVPFKCNLLSVHAHQGSQVHIRDFPRFPRPWLDEWSQSNLEQGSDQDHGRGLMYSRYGIQCTSVWRPSSVPPYCLYAAATDLSRHYRQTEQSADG